MRRTPMFGSPIVRLFAVCLCLSLAACAAYQAQHAASSGGGASPDAHAAAEPPGREYTDLSDDAQTARVRGEVEETKKNLAAKGMYACCVRPTCNECLLKRGHCRCATVARQGGPCCGECTEAWVEGKGVVEGLNAWDLLERRKKMLDEKRD
jgi:hypothetical protein